MYFVLPITAVFVFLCIYFFFSTEKLQRKLIMQRREGESTRKENKILVDAMALTSNRYEKLSKNTLEKKITEAKLNNNETLVQHLELISPLINNYSLILRECLKGKGKLKTIVQKCFNNHDEQSFKQFVALLVTSDKSLKRYWASNNLNGFLFLVEALLNHDTNHEEKEKKAKQQESDVTIDFFNK
jgi:hypothetical protein